MVGIVLDDGGAIGKLTKHNNCIVRLHVMNINIKKWTGGGGSVVNSIVNCKGIVKGNGILKGNGKNRNNGC